MPSVEKNKLQMLKFDLFLGQKYVPRYSFVTWTVAVNPSPSYLLHGRWALCQTIMLN
jgi:hypothetical protein